MNKEWDVFISHASEDKDSIVRELADTLQKLGVKVWYDEFTLKLGDSLTQSIDEGLIKSNFGVVVISKHFLNKRWTEYEYRSLLSKEEKGKELILPIWHNITRDEVKEFSLYLLDKVAIDTAKSPLKEIALEIISKVRPDIIHNIKAYFLLKKHLKEGETVSIPISKIKRAKERQNKLSKQQEVRARNIYYGIGLVLNYTIEEAIYSYELDVHPEREIQVFEITNLCFLEFIHKYQITDIPTKKEIAVVLIRFTLGMKHQLTLLNEDNLFELLELFKKYHYEY